MGYGVLYVFLNVFSAIRSLQLCTSLLPNDVLTIYMMQRYTKPCTASLSVCSTHISYYTLYNIYFNEVLAWFPKSESRGPACLCVSVCSCYDYYCLAGLYPKMDTYCEHLIFMWALLHPILNTYLLQFDQSNVKTSYNYPHTALVDYFND